MIKIKDYINNNYNIFGNLTFEHVNGVCIVNCDGDVEVKNQKIEKLTDGFVWGEVKGDFDCSKCNNLKSLEGAPEKVRGSFICINCTNLKSLKGAPKEVGSFYCSLCSKLISLKEIPKYINNDFLR